MSDQMPQGALFVEGLDDEHAVKQLLALHGIHIHDEDCPLRVHCKGSDSAVVEAISVAVKGSGRQPVGFVVDSDDTVERRWGQIRAKLVAVEVVPASPVGIWSDELPIAGFVAHSDRFERNVGVWIMPNNRIDYGKIEDLLATLVPTGEALFDLAKRATTEALAISAKRPPDEPAIQPKDERKGQLHSWLGWQKEPGMSYGHALRRKYFDHKSDIATTFVEWFKRLYKLN